MNNRIRWKLVTKMSDDYFEEIEGYTCHAFSMQSSCSIKYFIDTYDAFHGKMHVSLCFLFYFDKSNIFKSYMLSSITINPYHCPTHFDQQVRVLTHHNYLNIEQSFSYFYTMVFLEGQNTCLLLYLLFFCTQKTWPFLKITSVNRSIKKNIVMTRNLYMMIFTFKIDLFWWFNDL
jgi:hypothetical protein